MNNLNFSPLSSSTFNQILKRIGDFFISLFLIIALSPLLVLVSALVVSSSKGSAIYTQNRVGLNGKIFKMYKFRSMKIHDEIKYVQTVKNDTRITAIGKLIRRTSIDELPQLFNVLSGDMSLVGPRPVAIALNSKYCSNIKNFNSRHKVKPGMSGLAQINGYRGGDDNEHVKQRLTFDLEYISKWSLLLDLKILVITPIEVIRNHKVF